MFTYVHIYIYKYVCIHLHIYICIYQVFFIPRPLNISVLTNDNTVNKANIKNNSQEKYFDKSSIFSGKYSNKLDNYSANNSNNSNENNEISKNNDTYSSKLFGSQLRELLVCLCTCTYTYL
jgi:hypothetical protein